MNKTITIADKIEAQKKLVLMLGGDWDGMTQRELDAWWNEHCPQYVLTYVGQGATYIPFADLTTQRTDSIDLGTSPQALKRARRQF